MAEIITRWSNLSSCPYLGLQCGINKAECHHYTTRIIRSTSLKPCFTMPKERDPIYRTHLRRIRSNLCLFVLGRRMTNNISHRLVGELQILLKGYRVLNLP